MKAWQEVELGEVCEFKYGKSLAAGNRDGGQVPVYGSNGIVGAHSVALSNGPTIVVGRKGSFGEVAYSQSACWPIDTTYYVDRFATKADLKWLSYRLKGLGLTSLNRAAAIPGLNREDAYRQRLLLPPIDEQRRIARILDQADALRAKRRQVLAHLDSLTRSIFRNRLAAGHSEVRCLEDVAYFFGGSSLRAGEEFRGQDGGTLLMKVSDMNAPGNEDHIDSTALWTDAQTVRSATVDAGAVVLPKRGASIATNKKRMTTRRTALDPNLMGIQPRAEILTSRYLYEWLKSFDLASITSGSTVPQLNKQDLAPLAIQIPLLEEQVLLTECLALVDTQRASAQHAKVIEDELFVSLQSRAFRGEF